MPLTLDFDSYPSPCDARRVLRCNSWKPTANGLAFERATIFATNMDDLREAHAYYDATATPGMTTNARINRAIYLHEKFDAEARHLLFASDPSA